jgi:PAS domain S-box-containing protein
LPKASISQSGTLPGAYPSPNGNGLDLPYWEAIFNTVADGIIVTDASGIILAVNRAALAMVGYAADELAGKHIKILSVNGSDEKARPDIVRHMMAADYVGPYETAYRRKGGTAMPVEVNISLLRQRSGKPLRAIASFRDVTERQKARADLQQKEQELAEKSHRLEEANIALKVMLEQVEQERHESEEKILANLMQTVKPSIEKLRELCTTTAQQGYLDLLLHQVREIASSFASRLGVRGMHLTPTEMTVAHHLAAGRTTHIIAELMDISASAVNFHRRNIRQKLGIKSRRINLRAYLESIKNNR